MPRFDAIVIGAGPAGCQCARQLSKAGKKVLLLEKSKDFTVNNYSSGGAPLDIKADYALPDSLVSSYWQKLALHTSHNEHVWHAPEPMGVVLDFMKLRTYLAEDSTAHGAEVLLNSSYLHHEKKDKSTIVHIKRHEHPSSEAVETEVLVDATGAERSVLAKNRYDKSQALAATGIEYHIDIDPLTFQRYANTLSFFLGQRWMPQGYGWIFPIKPNQIKVGVIRYFLHEQIVSHDPSMRYYLEGMLHKCLGTSKPKILEKHGKTLYYTYKHKDLHYEENIIAIGDAVSTLNPLASEGIRHAMAGANIAAKHIISYLHGQSDFHSYPHDLSKYYGHKWSLSEKMMNRIYREREDHNLDLFLESFKRFSFQELIDLAFGYKWNKAFKFYTNYHLLKTLARVYELWNGR